LIQSILAEVVSQLSYVDDNENLGTEIGTTDGSSWARVHHAFDDKHGFRTLQAGLNASGMRSRRFAMGGLRTTDPPTTGSG
jgi:hypothetical protein